MPTTALQVSGRNMTKARRAAKDAIAKNQKIDGQGHLSRSSPLIIGATLGGVLRLVQVNQTGAPHTLYLGILQQNQEFMITYNMDMAPV